MSEKKYGNCPHCNAPCEVIEKMDVQNCDGDIVEMPYDEYNYNPQPGAVWVTGVKGFPIKKIVVAKFKHYDDPLRDWVIGKASSSTGEMITFDWNVSSITLDINHERWDMLYWLNDESPAEQPVAELLQLRQWKKEALLIINPIMEYAQGHKDAKLGSSLTEFVINRCKELDRMEAEQPVLPTFWDVAKAFKWAAEYGNELGEEFLLLEGQWQIIRGGDDETGNEDLTPGNVAELYCLQKGFDKAEQPGREVMTKETV